MINKEKSNCEHGFNFNCFQCEYCNPPAPKNYERDHSHTHCWNNQPSPCWQPIENHTQCCLCDTPVPKSEDCKHGNKGNCLACYEENRLKDYIEKNTQPASKSEDICKSCGCYKQTFSMTGIIPSSCTCPPLSPKEEESKEKEWGILFVASILTAVRVRKYGKGFSDFTVKLLAKLAQSRQEAVKEYKDELVRRFEERQALFNFVPEINGYKYIKAKDLDIINLIKQGK